MSRLREKKQRLPWREITLAVLGVIVILVLALQIRRAWSAPDDDNDVSSRDYSFEAFLADVYPAGYPALDVPDDILPEEALQSGGQTIGAADAEELEVFVSKPAGTVVHAFILLLHGGDASSRAAERFSQDVGEALATEHNAFVVSIDWRQDTVDGIAVADVVGTLEWARRYAELEDVPTIAIGAGHGGYIVQRALEEERDIDALITAYAYRDPSAVYTYIREKDGDEASLAAENFAARFGCDTAVATETCLRDAAVLPSARFTGKALVIHGSHDDIVPQAEANAIAAQFAAGETARIIGTAEAPVGHDFFAQTDSIGFAAGSQLVYDWLTAYTAKSL